jgi:DNA repair protein RecO (recombination protein O)
MEERASGIILRTRPLTETSLIVQWLTPDLGRISTVAKGARRPKSPFLGKLDLFFEADFSFTRSRRSELHNLREVSVRNSNSTLRQEMGRLSQGSYFVVLLEKSTETETPIPELHNLLQQSLALLGATQPHRETILAFDLNLLSVLGYAPDFGPLSGSVRAAGEAASSGRLAEAVVRLSALPSGAKQELNRFLQRSIGTALEKVPPQRDRALADSHWASN